MRRFSFTLLLLSFVAAAFAHAGLRNGEARDATQARYAIVRAAYEKFAEYNRAAYIRDGFDQAVAAEVGMRFQVRILGTGTIDEIRDALWTDVVTFPSGDLISGETIRESAHGYSQLAYPAQWTHGKWNSVFDPNVTVGHVLTVENATLHDVATYVAYEVTVHFEGRSRTYRAMAVFHDRYDRANRRIDFLDNVVGLNGAVTLLRHEAARPFRGFPGVDESGAVVLRSRPSMTRAPSGRGRIQSNFADTKVKAFPEWAVRSSEGHYTGAHGARGDFRIVCTWADSNNDHWCMASSGVVAYDEGYTIQPSIDPNKEYILHVPRVGHNANSGFAPHSQNVSCAVGTAYAFKMCAFYCNLSVEVSLSGKGAGASATAQAESDAKDVYADAFGGDCGPVDPVGTQCKMNGTEFAVSYTSDADCEPFGPSPVIIDVAGDGIELTGAADGVFFDLDSDGAAERLSWTAAGADDAFLAYDRNGDGAITTGRELFGNYTWQGPTPERNGFLALAMYDQPENGGNGDGIVDAGDQRFSSFVLWRDSNHDGVSSPSELQPLPASDVRAISLAYKESKRTDAHGNSFRYRAKVTPARAADVSKWAWDVFFVTP